MTKIVLLGAGSYVFGPSILAQLFLEYALDGVTLALVDPDVELAERMAGVARRMAREGGVRATVTVHSERRTALPDAEFVVCAVAVQLKARFATDLQCIARYYPDHLVTEFGGVAGISYSLRQIVMMESLCADMRELCPMARLLNVSNPLPRVCQAAAESGVETYGFCSASLTGYSLLWRLLTGKRVDYPYTAPREAWLATMAGLNHFCWVVELRERATGRDLLPEVQERLARGEGTDNPLCEGISRETGGFLVPHDGHVHDFLPPSGHTHSLAEMSHGGALERSARLELLRRVAAGEADWTPLLEHEAWEKPVALIAALCGGEVAELHSLNVLNNDVIANLPPQVFVEVPATVDKDGIHPRPCVLPPLAEDLCHRTAAVTDAIVRAGHTHSSMALREAVELDPTLVNKTAGWQALQACVNAHADLLPEFGLTP